MKKTKTKKQKNVQRNSTNISHFPNKDESLCVGVKT